MKKELKIISWNVNGIRACARKEAYFEYLNKEEPDILCIQESKANEEDIEEKIKTPSGYYSTWFSAQKKGYSGVGILTKHKPNNIIKGIGIEKYDQEGRVIQMDFDTFTLFNVYFPNGQKDVERLQYKLDFYKDFFNHCEDLKNQGRKIIICGDYNTAHHPIDLARPKENEKTSGFLKIEREELDRIINDYQYIDTFREFNKEPNQYSWWSFRTAARKRNIGWRIDYFFAHTSLKNNIKDAFIQQKILGSDHCPVGIIFSLDHE